jgi:hypothetical protein
VHAREERDAEWWCKQVASRSWRLDGGAHAEARRSQDRETATAAEVRATGGRRKGNGVNLDPGNPIYGRGHRIFL